MEKKNNFLTHRYRDVVEHNQDAIILGRPEGDVVFANHAACSMFGMTNEELVAGGRLGFTDPDDEVFQKAIEKRWKTGRFFGEINFLKKDRTQFTAEVSSSIFKKVDGRLMTTTIIRNINDRKKMEKALRESEIRYRELFENINSGVAVYKVIENGRDFILKDINSSGEDLGHTCREKAIGKSVLNIWPGIERFGLIEIFRRVFRTGKPVHYPVSLYEDDRLTAWFENYIYPLPSGEIVAVFDDVTERKKVDNDLKESEEQFRLVTQTVNDGLCLISASGKVLTWNKGAEKITGILSEDVVGKLSSDIDWPFVNEDGSKCLHDDLPPMKTIKTGKPFKHIVIGAVRPSGEIRWMSGNSNPLSLNGKDVPKAIAVSFSDITDLKNAKENLKTKVEQRTAELKNINDALKVLLRSREQDIQEVEEKIVANCETLIWPVLHTIRTYLSNENQKDMLGVLEENLRKIVSPFSKKLSDPKRRLTPSEIQIASMIKQGLSNKEIAQALDKSIRTITNHRDNIRKKLNLRNKKVNLRSFLVTFE